MKNKDVIKNLKEEIDIKTSLEFNKIEDRVKNTKVDNVVTKNNPSRTRLIKFSSRLSIASVALICIGLLIKNSLFEKDSKSGSNGWFDSSKGTSVSEEIGGTSGGHTSTSSGGTSGTSSTVGAIYYSIRLYNPSNPGDANPSFLQKDTLTELLSFTFSENEKIYYPLLISSNNATFNIEVNNGSLFTFSESTLELVDCGKSLEFVGRQVICWTPDLETSDSVISFTAFNIFQSLSAQVLINYDDQKFYAIIKEN